MTRNPFRFSDPALAALGILTAALGLAFHHLLGPPETYWTIDNGGKALVLQSLRENPTRFWIRYPGRSLDPGLRFFPQPLSGAEPYGELRKGQVVSQYLSPFLWGSLPLYAALGFAGLAVLPALGAGAAVILTGRLAARRGGSRAQGRAAAATVLVASPLLFYGCVLWEHTVVVALTAGALLALGDPKREHPGWGGLLLGTAALLREEMLLGLLAAATALLLEGRSRRTLARFAAAAAPGLLGLLLFWKATSGSWLGVHVSANRPVPFVHLGRAVEGLLLGAGFSRVGPACVGGIFAALGLARLLQAKRRRGGAPIFAGGCLALLIVSGLAFLRYPGGEDRALALIRSNSALVFVPWVLAIPFLPGAPRSGGRRDDLPARWAAIFLGLFLVFVPERSITGVHPGPRMLLPALPAAAVLAAERLRGRWLTSAPFALLLGIGVLWSARSIRILEGKREVAGRLAAAIRADPRRVVATDLFWLPTELAALWEEKQFHLVGSSEELAQLARLAAACGHREMLVVLAPGSVPNLPLRRVRAAGYPAFSADLHVQKLTPSHTRAE